MRQLFNLIQLFNSKHFRMDMEKAQSSLLDLEKLLSSFGKITQFLKDSICWMAGDDIIADILETIRKSREELNEEEKAAALELTTACQNIYKAQCASIAIVKRVHGLASDTLDSFKCRASKTNIINNLFENLDKEILPDLKKTCDLIQDVANSMIKVQGCADMMIKWCKRKIEETELESQDKVFQTRVIRCTVGAGASAVLAAGVGYLLFAMQLMTPVVAGGVAVACWVIAEGGLVYFTEEFTIPQIKALYKRQVRMLIKARENFETNINGAKNLKRNLNDEWLSLTELKERVLSSNRFYKLSVAEENEEAQHNLENELKIRLDRICEHSEGFYALREKRIAAVKSQLKH